MRFIVDIDVDGSEEEFARLFSQYLTEPEYPFIGDYGPEAWGGWVGPKMTCVVVADGDGETIARWSGVGTHRVSQ